jgi:hypothetical protein
MFRLRWHRERIAWLALFALVCQLVLSFGHVHLGKNVGNTWAGEFDSASIVDHRVPASPPGPVSTPDDFCAICANISLAGTLVIPILALVLAPVSVAIELPKPQADIGPHSIAHLLFRARGPPTV